MSENKEPISEDAMNDFEAEKWVAETLREAGKRSPLPASDLAIVKAAARHEWQQMPREARRQTSRWRDSRLLALAAVLLLVILTSWWWLRSRPFGPQVTVATIEVVSGDPSLTVGSGLAAGTSITSKSPMAIRLSGGESVRLTAGTELGLLGSSRLRLDHGTVYVDSGRVSAGTGIAIETDHGVVREIGTQFEVRVSAAVRPLRVRVREGEVLVRIDGDARAAVAGEELVLRGDGSIRRRSVDPFGAEWDWIQEVAPGFADEESTLAAYLDWVVREIGCRLEFEDAELERAAAGIDIYGYGSSLEALTPAETLEVVLPGSGLGYRLEDGTLRVIRD